MAVTVAELQAKLTADTRGFDRAMDRSHQTASRVGHGIATAAQVAGAAVAVGLGVVAKVGWDEYAQGAKVAAQTNAVLKSTGGVASVTAKHVDELSSSLLRQSGVDDELIKAGENMLLTFTSIRNSTGKNNDIFDQATKLTLDLSVAMGKDMTDSAILVGKALNDPQRGLTALRRVGVAFTDDQQKLVEHLVKTGRTMDAQKIVLAELRREFGGSARAAGKTFPGQLAILRESLSNAAGDVVGLFIPALTHIASFISQTLVPAFSKTSDWLGRIFKARGFSAKLKITWTGVRDVANDLLKVVGDQFASASASIKPLKLKSGKIVEFDRSEQRGLVVRLMGAISPALASAFELQDWGKFGSEIGKAIGEGIRVSADWVGTLLRDATSWLLAHVSDIAEFTAELIVRVVEVLTDPKFWLTHLDLLVAVLSIFFLHGLGGAITKMMGVGRGLVQRGMFVLVGRMGEALGRGIERLGIALATAFERLFGEVGASVGGAIRDFVLGMAQIMRHEFVKWFGRIIRIFNALPEFMRKILSIGFVLAFARAMIEAFRTVKRIGGQIVGWFRGPFVGFFGAVWDGIKGGFRAAFSFVLGIVRNYLTFYRRVLHSYFEVVRSVVESVKLQFSRIKDFIEGVINAVRRLIQWFKDMPGKIRDALSGVGGIIGKAFSFTSKINPFSGDGIVSAGGGPKSVSRTLYDDLALASASGLVLTSGYRPGAITSTGNPSLHGVYPSKAIDVAGSEASMRRFFLLEVMRGAATGLREIIHSPYWWHPGAGISRIPASAGSVLRDHYSHVHVGSYDKGGFLSPGWNLAYNGLGRPEPVGGGSNVVYNFNGAVLDGEKLLRFIREEDARWRRRGG